MWKHAQSGSEHWRPLPSQLLALAREVIARKGSENFQLVPKIKFYQGSCASPDPLAGLNTALWECSDLECVSKVSRDFQYLI